MCSSPSKPQPIGTGQVSPTESSISTRFWDFSTWQQWHLKVIISCRPIVLCIVQGVCCMVHGALYMVHCSWCMVRKWENPLSSPMSSFWRSVRSFLFNFNFLKKYFHFFIPMAQVGEASLQGQTFDARRRRPLDNTWEQVSNCLQQATQHWQQCLL